MKFSKIEKISLVILTITFLIFSYSLINNQNLISIGFILIILIYVIRLVVSKRRKNNNYWHFDKRYLFY
jgi:hypothetical protein